MQNRTILTFSSIIFFLISCSNERIVEQWDDVKINSDISKDSIYSKLNKEPEATLVFEKFDPHSKRTNNVTYRSGKFVKGIDAKFNNCRAYFLEDNILAINIGMGDGFVSDGFIIKYNGKKFYTETYFSTDVINENETKSVHKIVYQKLELNKSSYKIGDSIYGKIDFKEIEKDGEGKKIENYGKGNFRAKITKTGEI